MDRGQKCPQKGNQRVGCQAKSTYNGQMTDDKERTIHGQINQELFWNRHSCSIVRKPLCGTGFISDNNHSFPG
jgi:hypothetical protein